MKIITHRGECLYTDSGEVIPISDKNKKFNEIMEMVAKGEAEIMQIRKLSKEDMKGGLK